MFELVLDDGFEVLVVDFLFLVAEGLELVEGLVEAIVRQAEAEFFEASLEGVAAGMLAEDVLRVWPSRHPGGA